MLYLAILYFNIMSYFFLVVFFILYQLPFLLFAIAAQAFLFVFLDTTLVFLVDLEPHLANGFL